MAFDLDDNSIIVPTRRSDTDDGSPDIPSDDQEILGPWRVVARIPDLNAHARSGALAGLPKLWSWIPHKSKQISLAAAGAAAVLLLGIWLGRMTGEPKNHIDDWNDLPRASVPGMPLGEAPRFRPAAAEMASEQLGSSTKGLPADLSPRIPLPDSGNSLPRPEPSAGPLMPGTLTPSGEERGNAAETEVDRSTINRAHGSAAAPSPPGTANRHATLSDASVGARVARRSPQSGNVSGDYPSHSQQPMTDSRLPQPAVTGARPLTENDRP